jgi:hypothetical protein
MGILLNIAIIVVSVIAVLFVIALIVMWRAKMSPAEGAAYLRELGIEAAKIPGRLRRLARDPRVPRRARWWLVGLAIYIASPIDIVPDFLPVIGQLDDVLIVALVIRHVRRMIPAEAWDDAFGK